MKKQKILFLCTGNSCRSQMAEGWCRHLKGDRFEPYSAGIETHGMNPFAVQVMKEAGVDISEQWSKTALAFENAPLDYVITVCDHASSHCPSWMGHFGKVIHVSFDDPPKLAAAETTEEGKLRHYRRVRDEIRDFIRGLPRHLK